MKMNQNLLTSYYVLRSRKKLKKTPKKHKIDSKTTVQGVNGANMKIDQPTTYDSQLRTLL